MPQAVLNSIVHVDWLPAGSAANVRPPEDPPLNNTSQAKILSTPAFARVSHFTPPVPSRPRRTCPSWTRKAPSSCSRGSRRKRSSAHLHSPRGEIKRERNAEFCRSCAAPDHTPRTPRPRNSLPLPQGAPEAVREPQDHPLQVDAGGLRLVWRVRHRGVVEGVRGGHEADPGHVVR